MLDRDSAALAVLAEVLAVTNLDKLRLGDLALFCRVVELGSFAAAARATQEQPRQVSRRIGAMEREIGLQLFLRSTRTLSVTPEGTRLYGAVRDAVSELDAAADGLADPNAIEGLVRLQIPTLMPVPVLRWMSEVSERHPALSFDLRVSDSVGDLVLDGLDVVLTSVPPEGTELLCRKVGLLTPRLYASRSYVAVHGLPSVPSELANHRALRFRGERPQTHWTLVHRDGHTIQVPIQGSFECSDSRALAQAVVAGLGIGLQPPYVPIPDNVVPVLPDWRFGGIDMYLVIAPGRHRLARVRLVIDMLAELCSGLSDSEWSG